MAARKVAFTFCGTGLAILVLGGTPLLPHKLTHVGAQAHATSLEAVGDHPGGRSNAGHAQIAFAAQ